MKDSTGRFLTKALFVEFDDGVHTPIFALKQHNATSGTPWLRDLYMQYEDPTEAHFAEEVFGDQAHWRKLCKAQWFQEYISQWREDLAGILSARGVALMKNHAPKSPVAAKWLAERGWDAKPNPRRGRPSNAEVEQERRRMAEDKDFYREAADRLSDYDD